MITTVSEYEFIKAFDDYDRSNNFSVEGRKALYDYFETLEEDCGETIELDVIAICCEFTEYDNLKDFHQEYDKTNYPNLDSIRKYTQVIEIPESKAFIIQCF